LDEGASDNRFSGFLPLGKPLKRFQLLHFGLITELKLGVNEIG
jgi:hypothetical protein